MKVVPQKIIVDGRAYVLVKDLLFVNGRVYRPVENDAPPTELDEIVEQVHLACVARRRANEQAVVTKAELIRLIAKHVPHNRIDQSLKFILESGRIHQVAGTYATLYTTIQHGN